MENLNLMSKNRVCKTDGLVAKILLYRFLKLVFFIGFLFFYAITPAQKTTLVFSKSMLNKTPKSVQIELSDSSGNINPSETVFNQMDFIYFVVKPLDGQDWKLSKKDVEKKLAELKLLQSINSSNTSFPKIIFAFNEVYSAVLAFPKSEISFLKEMQFKLEENTSDKIKIPEKLYPGYKKFTSIIENSQAFSSKGEYLEAFQCQSKLWCKDSMFLNFSFYSAAKDSLTFYADEIIRNSNSLFNSKLETFKNNINEANLEELLITRDTLQTTLLIVEKFISGIKNEIDAVTRLNQIDQFKLKLTNEINKSKLIFRKKKLALFETKNYQDYQFKVYLEAISKLITSVDRINKINSFDSIHLDKISNFPAINREIKEMGWSVDFESVCKLLNENILRFHCIFNDTVINNLSQCKTLEPQPYFAFFKAYNALVKKDKNLFTDLISQCLYAVSDKELLSSLDLYLSLVNSEISSNDDYWNLIQTGYTANNAGSLQDAKMNYEKAEKLSNTGEILFFLMAQNNIKLSDRYSAEIYFKRATAINPKFILPKLYQIDFLIEDKDYETAITIANEALATNPIWYFYYKKGLLMGLTGKFAEAKQILTANCISLNPLNYDQYLVLGDVQNALGDAKSARESYMKAGNIKPNDSGYKSRMELLKQSQEVKPIK